MLQRLSYKVTSFTFSLLLLLTSCKKHADKFVGTWKSDTYRSSLVISQASENSYIIQVKYGASSDLDLDREVPAFYNKSSNSLEFKLRRINPVSVEYEDYSVNAVYIEDEDKLFCESRSFGHMSRDSKSKRGE